ncbi:cytochrome P450 2J6-like isoform X2 [Corvus cornix cornix]|uniref:cytochrome P450 2J6 isoform X2 n=1 Tax=Corvus brachyrhynchos TaxID=85066 RepID=UPI000816495B|nr:PREDICTED: cytochrome P450 2J6 isoform X2 [Corvus brachyrhynchos]XP_019140141.1 cytochrome P450 2J6-like isoform X2 [Corvus cornix cornix]
MLTITQSLIGLIIFLLIVEFFRLRKACKQFPPGPTPLPLLGNLVHLNFQFHRDLLMELAKTHGNMYTLWFGWVPVVILNGFEAVKDGMTTHPEDVSGRLVSPFFRALAKGKGIILASGRSWKQQRRFGIMTLRNLGMGKKGLEHRVQEEASHLVELFVNLKGRPVDPSFPLFHSISNVICAVVFGYHFSDEDKTFHELIRATEQIFRFAGSFVHQSKEGAKPKYDEENLVYVINDLFLGGSETSSTTLYWGLLYMVVNPDIQEKVQKELDAVLGPSQLICYEDRRKLPYTNAVVHEIQRFSNIVFVGVPRVCVRNTTLLGFPVRKGTIVIPNIASVLYDPEQWETPRQFNPGHFLDKEGNFIPREAFLPFSAGHRVCLGEHLARTELFIFFASLLRAFTFRLPEGVSKISTEPLLGGTLQPHPYRVCAIPR